MAWLLRQELEASGYDWWSYDRGKLPPTVTISTHLAFARGNGCCRSAGMLESGEPAGNLRHALTKALPFNLWN
jgi:hypothetical protein